jgi:hypothetical protein
MAARKPRTTSFPAGRSTATRAGRSPSPFKEGASAVGRRPRRSPDPPEVRAYLDSVPDERRELVRRVHDVVRRAAPELVPFMYGTYVGYGPYHYRYESGREGDWFVVGLANQKRYVSVYLCATVDGAYLAEANAARLGKVSVGKSCIRITKAENVDWDVLAELVRTTADAAEAGAFGM